MEYDNKCRCAECVAKRQVNALNAWGTNTPERIMLRKCVDYLEPRVGHIPESRGFALLNELKEFLK